MKKLLNNVGGLFHSNGIAFEGDPIICAVCNKPIEAYETWYDVAERAHIIRFHCHGKTDVHQLPTAFLMKCGVDGLKIGKAFVKECSRLSDERS